MHVLLQVAMSRTKKLCAVIIDTLGREVMVRRPCVFGPDGWPAHLGDHGKISMAGLDFGLSRW
jgi:hypothetical protein